MNTLIDSENSIHLTWIVVENGLPRIRWARIVAFVLAAFGSYMASSLVLSYLLGVEVRLATTFLMTIGSLAGLVIMVELQRQRALTGRWSFRFSISSCLILTTLAALFFLVVGNDVRAMRLGQEANLVTKAELEELMDGGDAYINSLDGTGVTCNISRASFSDAELDKLIEISSRRSEHSSQMSCLNLEKTAVTDAGVRKLASCPHLHLLALPPIYLSDETIASIGKCKELNYLSLDDAKLAEKQFAALRISLPKLKLNGKQWKDRDIGEVWLHQ